MWGELGIIPPSVKCHINILCYYDRLRSLPDDMLVKRAYNEAVKLHEQGFTTRVSKVWDIANKYGINLDNINLPFRNAIKQLVTEHFKNHWKASIVDIASNPILRTYKLFKTDFKFETYLDVVKDNRYRHTLIKLRTRSHTLGIERGRYNKTDVKQRLCPYCMRIDDEEHFILNCDAIVHERQCLFNKIRIRYPIFFDLDDMQTFQFLMTSEDPQILTWLAKFIYHGFNKRNDIH